MNKPRPKRGRPRRHQPDPPALGSGVWRLLADLDRLSRAGDAPAMDRAFRDWLQALWERARHDGPDGDACMRYLDCFVQIWTAAPADPAAWGLNPTADDAPTHLGAVLRRQDAETRHLAIAALRGEPDALEALAGRLPNETAGPDPAGAVILQLLPRVFSHRRDARAYTRHLLDLLDARAAAGLSIPQWWRELAAIAAARNLRGKGRGADPDIYWRPARDEALRRAYDAGATLAELGTPEGQAAAFADYLPPWARPTPNRDGREHPNLLRDIARGRAAAAIRAQCHAELMALSEFVPWVCPGGPIVHALLYPDWPD